MLTKIFVKQIKASVEGSGQLKGSFLIENLGVNQALTVANSLRRSLLTEIDGTAITGIKNSLLGHEFAGLSYIREDLLEIILNLKQVVLKNKNRQQNHGVFYGYIDFLGPGIITSEFLNFGPDIEVINKNHYIATLTEPYPFQLGIRLETGKSYQLVEFVRAIPYDRLLGEFLPIDAIFMPVLNVTYSIQSLVSEQGLKKEQIILDIITNGSITPEAAFFESALHLRELFNFDSLTNETQENLISESFVEADTIKKEIDNFLLEELELSVRPYKCLKGIGIRSIKELEKYSLDDIKKIKNFGRKSAQEVYYSAKNKFNLLLPILLKI